MTQSSELSLTLVRQLEELGAQAAGAQRGAGVALDDVQRHLGVFLARREHIALLRRDTDDGSNGANNDSDANDAAEERKLLLLACMQRCRVAHGQVRAGAAALDAAAGVAADVAARALALGAACGDARALGAPRAGGTRTPVPPLVHIERAESVAASLRAAVRSLASALAPLSLAASVETLARADAAVEQLRVEFDL